MKDFHFKGVLSKEDWDMAVNLKEHVTAISEEEEKAIRRMLKKIVPKTQKEETDVQIINELLFGSKKDKKKDKKKKKLEKKIAEARVPGSNMGTRTF